MIKNIVLKNRSYRRFYGDYKIERATIEELIDLARLSPSGRNLQPLKYFISCDDKTNAEIFPKLAWAGYLKDWGGPVKDERPTAYVVILVNRDVTAATPSIDVGIACQSILLGAAEKDLGGCIIQSVRRPELAEVLKIPLSLEIALVIALGKPKEEVKIVPTSAHGDIKYYRDEEGIHYVPKRGLKDIIL